MSLMSTPRHHHSLRPRPRHPFHQEWRNLVLAIGAPDRRSEQRHHSTVSWGCSSTPRPSRPVTRWTAENGRSRRCSRSWGWERSRRWCCDWRPDFPICEAPTKLWPEPQPPRGLHPSGSSLSRHPFQGARPPGRNPASGPWPRRHPSEPEGPLGCLPCGSLLRGRPSVSFRSWRGSRDNVRVPQEGGQAVRLIGFRVSGVDFACCAHSSAAPSERPGRPRLAVQSPACVIGSSLRPSSSCRWPISSR